MYDVLESVGRACGRGRGKTVCDHYGKQSVFVQAVDRFVAGIDLAAMREVTQLIQSRRVCLERRGGNHDIRARIGVVDIVLFCDFRFENLARGIDSKERFYVAADGMSSGVRVTTNHLIVSKNHQGEPWLLRRGIHRALPWQ